MTLQWTPSIGDPTPVGWFTVIAYLGAAIFCGVAAAKSTERRLCERVSDFGSAWRQFLFLSVNKQLDLQSLFTEIAQATAVAQELYGGHRFYQVAFVAVVGIAGTVTVLAALWPALS